MLKSWKNSDDPAPGNFEFGLDEGELKQFFIYRRSIPNRRAVFWNGSAYDDTSRWGFGWNAVNYSVIDSKTELYFTFHSPSATAMVVMTPEGYLNYIEAGANSLQTTNWIGERDLCSVSQGCSAYSICNVNRRPVCMCLPGFETIESGCKRKTDLHCGRDEGVLVLKGVEMPAFNGYARLKDEEKCRKFCFSGGCDCKGFAFINESKCGIQADDLRDIREEEHGRLELVHNISIPVLASDLKLNGRQCSNCGANIIPYPLSTDIECGHPNYNALFCNISNGQLYFRTTNGSYFISSINADSRTLVIVPEGVDLCWSRSTKRRDIHLNSKQPFHVTDKNTILLFNCSTPGSSNLTCTDSSACHRYVKEGRVPCYNQEKCCSYVVEDSPDAVGVLSTGCNAYASIVNLNLSWSTYDWREGVEISWDPLPGRKRRLPGKISIIVIVGVFLLGTIVYLLWRNIKKKGYTRPHERLVLLGENEMKELDVPFYEFGSVLQATENFSDSNKLGQGGFGDVYKGKLLEGQEVAVKRLSKSSGQDQEEFKNEVLLIAKLQHRNLVRLLGYCIQEDERLLLYEYMPNKSLDFFLFDPDRCKLLSWEKRHNIILGITKGLLYLHEDSRLRIIHRDLKTSNILLDEEMKPKISDFGLARIFGGNQIQENTNRVVGTYGYMSPEYAFHGLFSVKSDVFSFGVILLEIVSGKKNSLIFHDEESLTLLGYAWKLWKEEKWLDFIDESLSVANELPEVRKCMQIGLLCVQENTADRPTMASVLGMFISEATTLRTPKQPAFITTSVPIPNSSRCSKNEVTISLLLGR
ncbi:hypothetical protein AAC387_Pa04g1500 [Persea americana]